jgi:SusD family.
MNTIKKFIISIVSLVAITSCNEYLNLSPIDYYGSQNYWKSEAHFDAYIDGLHKNMRDVAFQHSIVFGELRGGLYTKANASVENTQMQYGVLRLQNLSQDNPVVSNFGNIYGRITNLNLFIKNTTETKFLSEEKRNNYLAIAHGLRAFYYFDLYRVYGGVPLRLGIEVIEGNINPTELYLERAQPSAVMAQIKDDLKKSLDFFGNTTDWDPYGHGKKAVWSKAATECLIGEVYLWNAKVSIGDNKANPADLEVAKTHLTNVMNSYGLNTLPSFASVFDANNKANDEVIFAIRFVENEATNNNGSYLYAVTTGALQPGDFYTEDADNNFIEWDDPLELKTITFVMAHEYAKEFFQKFDKEDSRRLATFLPAYSSPSFDDLKGTNVRKNIGYINSQGMRVMCGDYIYYRLPWVYLSLAEIENMQGNNPQVEFYINKVRERAYGEKWDAKKYGYKAGSFTDNEYAILFEKDKEFVQEGQRWWDVLRMTETKGGTPLVFTERASIDGIPILNKDTEAYKVLWPLNKGLLDNDPSLLQTPGYEQE